MLADTMSFGNVEDYAGLSDADALARSRRQPAFFALIVRRYEAPFLRRARRVLGNDEDAKEAVQDAFTKIYLYADRYAPQEGATFSSWAYTVLNRVLYTAYERNKERYRRRAQMEPEHYESLPDERAEFLENLSVRSEVIAALAKLPETAARFLRLQFIEGKSQEEIAKTEGISVPAVKTRVHRAKKLFKQSYEAQRHDRH